MDLLAKVKLALGLANDAYDSELSSLITAAQLDLGLAGVVLPDTLDALCERAVITYCKFHFASLPDGEYDRTKRSYDEQKAQLMMGTGYTEWGE